MDVPTTADDGDPRALAPEQTRPTKHRRKQLRRWLIGLLSLLAVVTAAWLVTTALLARAELTKVQSGLSTLHDDVSDQNFDKARADASALGTHTKRAHELTTGPAWWAVAEIPWLGRPAQVVRVAAAVADQLAETALPSVTQAAAQLNPHTLRSGQTIRLQPIRAIAPALHSATVSTADAASKVAALPEHTWLGSVDRSRQQLADQLAKISTTLVSADRTAQLAPDMLGESGTRRYFIAIQNDAEARGTGGIPGSFVVLTATHGALSFEHFGSDTELDGTKADVRLSADYLAKWRQSDPAAVYVNSDVGANPVDAAKIWAAMWLSKTGQHIDGVVSVDPTAISYLLRASGPAELPDGEKVSADNIVSLTQKDVYARFPDKPARKAFLLVIAKAVNERLLHSGDTAGLVKNALLAASERRLSVWSAHPAEQRELLQTSLSRDWTAGTSPVSGFTVVNAAGSKLDYYLGRSMTYARTGCGVKRTVQASITLSNNAPTKGLPDYVTIRADKPPYPTKPGDNRVILNYYGTRGGVPTSVTLDGKNVPVAVSTENGLLAVAIDIELPAGKSRTVRLQVSEPPGAGDVRFIQQPSVQPEKSKISGASGGICVG